MSRNLRIVLTVLLLHGAALWALQTGLLRRTAELLIPAMMLADMAEPAVKPEPEPPAPPVPVRQRIAPTTPTPLAHMTSEITIPQAKTHSPCRT